MTNSGTPSAGESAAAASSPPASAPQAQAKALLLLRAAAKEAQEGTRQTAQQLGRFYGYGRAYAKQRFAQRQTDEIMVRLGQRLFELGLGDATLREQHRQIHERIRNLEAAKSSTRKLEAELRGVLIRLAESVLNGPAPPEVAEEFDQASQATAAQRERQERLAHERAMLLPPDRPSRVRVGAGLAALGVVAVFLLWVARPYIGLGPSLGPRAGELIGTWNGTHQLGMGGITMKAGYTIQFRRDGRVRWEVKVLEDTSGITEIGKKMAGDSSESDLGTGKWRVDHAEGNVFSIRVVNDLHPDETKAFGWRATLEDSDKMTLVNFVSVPIKLTCD